MSAAQGEKSCSEHKTDEIRGFCKDCFSGICFRCAIGKHRNHNIVNIDELDKSDLENQIQTFEGKIQGLKEKANIVLKKVRSSEQNNEKLPEILTRFRQITQLFENGHYKDMIVGELEKNYGLIKEMAEKLD